MMTRVNILSIETNELRIWCFHHSPKLGFHLINCEVGSLVVVALEALEGTMLAVSLCGCEGCV